MAVNNTQDTANQKRGNNMWTWLEKIIGTKTETAVEPKRAREKGRYKADDKSTPDVNEAWEGGVAPKKKIKIRKGANGQPLQK